MTALEFRNVSKKLRHTVIARDMNLSIRDNSFSVIFGAPGSGKSTLLRLITGFEKPDKGEIFLHDQPVNRVSSAERNIGYVPQSFALYPHYSVFDNIAYPLRLMGMNKTDIVPVVEGAARRLQITHLLKKRPDQCSGGEKQRVAIARGIVKNTRIFILDDPLTGLDFKLRERLFDDLRQMKEELAATFIYTTSDPLETLILAEDIHVFDGGTIIESGDLASVYHQPQHVRTMALLGYPTTNLFAGKVTQRNGQNVCVTEIFTFPVEIYHAAHPDLDVQVALRPQHIRIDTTSSNGLIKTNADITLVEDLGGELHIYLEAGTIALETLMPHHDAAHVTEGHTTIGIVPSDFKLYAATDHRFIGQGVY